MTVLREKVPLGFREGKALRVPRECGVLKVTALRGRKDRKESSARMGHRDRRDHKVRRERREYLESKVRRALREARD